ncbi:MAG TPA: TIGR03032 family protein [Pirellulales bacterium]|nr:TIGR03032 family protein [Pirellulales bacterium]
MQPLSNAAACRDIASGTGDIRQTLPLDQGPVDRPSSSEALRVDCAATAGFAQWMASAGGSVAGTTYQAGKVVLAGWNGFQVTLLMRHFDKPMGLAVHGANLALACRHEVLFFANAPLLAHDYAENQPGRYDALYLPRSAWFTGDLNLHDIAFGGDASVGQDGLWLVNTRFSCLSTLGPQFHFLPAWQPPFISQLAPEDRCHLNGLGMEAGRPKYVTALGATDEPGGWRANKAAGGVLIDVGSGAIALAGLSMPHSPRLHDGKWWLLNSGAGELWTVDPQRGDHTVVCALPGYLRGLCFVGSYALVGMSQVRERHIFGNLPVQQRHDKLLCGIALIDLRTGVLAGMLEFTAGCRELYDVQFLPGVRQAMILNLQNESVRQAVTAPGFSYWFRPSSEVH